MKKIIALAMAMVMVLGLVACGSNNQPADVLDTQDKVESSIWTEPYDVLYKIEKDPNQPNIFTGNFTVTDVDVSEFRSNGDRGENCYIVIENEQYIVTIKDSISCEIKVDRYRPTNGYEHNDILKDKYGENTVSVITMIDKSMIQ